MSKAILVTLAMALLAAGQEKQDAKVTHPGPRVQKVFQVKHADVDSLWNAFHQIANMRVDKNLKLLVVDGSPEAVKAIEDALKTLDVPVPAPTIKNVELTFHIILAKPDKNGALPQALDAVQKNLESLFGFRGFYLLETAYMRGRDGNEVRTNGAIPTPTEPDSPHINYSILVHPSVSAGEKGNVIRLNRLQLHLKLPVVTGADPLTKKKQFQMHDAGMNTQIDVREGQRVVVGKANMNASDGALVLVVTAKVVE
jgi:hypothetical protein